MTLEITVRGAAEHEYPAERATISMAVSFEGDDKKQVAESAAGVHDPLTSQLEQLSRRDAVTSWSSDQVRVFSHRPFGPDGQRLDLVHVARLEVVAEFVDFERLSGFVDYWSGHDGVVVDDIRWDVTARNRRGYEAENRKAAVDDAVQKAQVLANAARRGKVAAHEFADPGMLTGSSSAPGAPSPMMARVAADTGESLALRPRRIVVRVEVDARFRAD